MFCLNNDLLTNLDHANSKSEHRDNPSVLGELGGGLALSAFKQKSEEHNPKKESTILRRKKNTIS